MGIIEIYYRELSKNKALWYFAVEGYEKLRHYLFRKSDAIQLP